MVNKYIITTVVRKFHYIHFSYIIALKLNSSSNSKLKPHKIFQDFSPDL